MTMMMTTTTTTDSRSGLPEPPHQAAASAEIVQSERRPGSHAKVLAGLNRRRGAADLRTMDNRLDNAPVGCGAARRVLFGRPRGFTLIEILIVVVILGILSVLVIPQFTDASEETNETSVRRHLQILRHQIEFFRATRMADPDFLGSQWDDLLVNDLLQSIPKNPYNDCTLIDAVAGPGVGWVWRDNGFGVRTMYATDDAFAEFVE